MVRRDEERRETVQFKDGEIGTYSLGSAPAFQKLFELGQEKEVRKDALAYLDPQVEFLKKYPFQVPPDSVDIAIRMNLIWFSGYWSEDLSEAHKKQILWIINTNAIEIPVLFVSWDLFNRVNESVGLGVSRFRKEKRIPPSVEIFPSDLRVTKDLKNSMLFLDDIKIEDSEFVKNCREEKISLLSHRFLEVPGGKFVCNGLLPMDFQLTLRIFSWGVINLEKRITTEKGK